MERNMKYMTLREVSEHYGWPFGGLRGAVFKRQKNGLNRAVIKIGKKLLIEVAEFEKWLSSKRETTPKKRK